MLTQFNSDHTFSAYETEMECDIVLPLGYWSQLAKHSAGLEEALREVAGSVKQMDFGGGYSHETNGYLRVLIDSDDAGRDNLAQMTSIVQNWLTPEQLPSAARNLTDHADEVRNALHTNSGTLAYRWRDKPHQIVFGLCNLIKELAEVVETATAVVKAAEREGSRQVLNGHEGDHWEPYLEVPKDKIDALTKKLIRFEGRVP